MTTNGASASPGGATGAEQHFCRTLNRLAEPVVRAGLGSSLAGPGSLRGGDDRPPVRFAATRPPAR